MKNKIVEATKEENEEDGEIKIKTINDFIGNHLGPKTKETELRLGFSSSSSSLSVNNSCNNGITTSGCNPIFIMGSEEKSSKRLISSSDDQTLVHGFVVNKQRNDINGGFGTTKRWGFDHGVGFGNNNPWSNNFSSSFDPIPTQEKAVLQSTLPPTRGPPMVGWPPVRSTFRRNIISSLSKQSHMKSKAAAAAADDDDKVLIKKSNDHMDTVMYVKVNMEGYAVGRKINLKAHHSYESLFQSLQKMFHDFLSSVNHPKNKEKSDEEAEEVGSDKHVLLYEDNEGDRMLVGDVPWGMFISTVKRLFIITGSKAPEIIVAGIREE